MAGQSPLFMTSFGIFETGPSVGAGSYLSQAG